MEEIRVSKDEYDEKLKQLTRRGMKVKRIAGDGEGGFIVSFEAGMEVRTEQPDGAGSASRRVDL